MRTIGKICFCVVVMILLAANANAGRWLTQDPIGFMERDLPASQINLYAFVGNNPVNRIDPLGLYWLVSSTPFPGQNPSDYGPYVAWVPGGGNRVYPAMSPSDYHDGGIDEDYAPYIFIPGSQALANVAADARLANNLLNKSPNANGKQCPAKNPQQAISPAVRKFLNGEIPLSQVPAKEAQEAADYLENIVAQDARDEADAAYQRARAQALRGQGQPPGPITSWRANYGK
jgi:uncharacterized protein RhaS with RHS repeats